MPGDHARWLRDPEPNDALKPDLGANGAKHAAQLFHMEIWALDHFKKHGCAAVYEGRRAGFKCYGCYFEGWCSGVKVKRHPFCYHAKSQIEKVGRVYDFPKFKTFVKRDDEMARNIHQEEWEHAADGNRHERQGTEQLLNQLVFDGVDEEEKNALMAFFLQGNGGKEPFT